jgi:4-amino-4-deoxy-L-arabinose transferase-like glycosyltransferase
LFARELVPSVSWFGPVAALAVAFEPMFVHMGGGVSNDNLLTVFAAATLYLGARMLRRGPSTKLAVATGVAFALGVFAKPTIVGLLPALLLVLLVAALRDRENRGVNVRRLAIGVGALVAIVVVGAALFGIGGGTGASLASGSGGKQPVTLTGLINFTWQWYLPAIPGTGQFFVGVPPFFGTFVRGFVGNFNSLDTPFPNWLYALATVVGVVLVGGAIAAVYQRRDRLRSQWPLVAYPLLAIVGVAAFVNLTTYLVLVHDGTPFAQGRYLFPAIGVFGLLVAAGSLGFGRRRGLVVATAVVLSLGMLDVLGMGLSMARFYV